MARKAPPKKETKKPKKASFPPLRFNGKSAAKPVMVIPKGKGKMVMDNDNDGG